MAERGRLEPLLITAGEPPDFSASPAGEFASDDNPSEITIACEVEDDSAPGTTVCDIARPTGIAC